MKLAISLGRPALAALESEDAVIHNTKDSRGLPAILWLDICETRGSAALFPGCPLRTRASDLNRPPISRCWTLLDAIGKEL